MTVFELMKQLEHADPDADVLIWRDNGESAGWFLAQCFGRVGGTKVVNYRDEDGNPQVLRRTNNFVTVE